jgi:hypothetical protein
LRKSKEQLKYVKGTLFNLPFTLTFSIIVVSIDVVLCYKKALMKAAIMSADRAITNTAENYI